MSSDIAIRVEGLSKRYILQHKSAGDGLRHAIQRKISAPFRKMRSVLGAGRVGVPGSAANGHLGTPASRSTEEFWALKNVSLEIKRGEAVGIIGHNGAGKSTLLKILSRITEPTTGRIEIDGRIASLLEVGTGFHPELTGRENIFLNGAILGMSRQEILGKFDEIVDFAEVDKFIDTPVKRYSSGMYVRLAFAVAAHLNPEILIVDEVLAVGDIDFQRKCLGSMQRAANSGKTVLLVSHNLAILETLCSHGVLLSQGGVEAVGKPRQVIERYNTSAKRNNSRSIPFEPGANPHPRFIGVAVHDSQGIERAEVSAGEKIVIRLMIESPVPVKRPWIGIRLTTPEKVLIAHIANRESGYDLNQIQGEQIVTCELNKPNLLPGRYYVSLILADASNNKYHEVNEAVCFDVTQADVFGAGMPLSRDYGMVFLDNSWAQIG